MISTRDIDDIIGAEALDADDDRIGKVGQVYLEQDTDEPVWVSVKSGLFGTSETLVPLSGANWDRSALHLPFSKSQVKDAPRVDPDAELSPEEQERLYEYYGMNGSGSTGRSGGFDDPAASDRDRYTAAGGGEGTIGRPDSDITGSGTGAGLSGAGVGRTVGHDTSGPTTDEAMTRSEERLRVGTEKVETGRARLRKYVVHDRETVEVPVTREEVRVEREPITDADRGDALDGPDLSSEEHEVVLTEERPVVDKETVPVERVRLTENRQVSEDVRREEIDTDGGDATGRTTR